VTILVTGASGFIGSALCAHLLEQNMTVVGAVRRLPDKKVAGVDYRVVADLSDNTNWREALTGVNTVVHCAARVHVMRDTEDNPLQAFRNVNVRGTIRLAEQAVDGGLKRFIYISSIKVNGEKTDTHPFCADDTPAPEDPYGISKWETEQALQKIATETDLEVVIIRPPLVYGPGVRANFLRLMQMVNMGVPLPLGSIIENRRSLVALDNLVDLIATCLNHPAAVNQTFLVSDGKDLSTRALLQYTAKALDRPARLIPVPVSILEMVACFLGKKDFVQRLCGSLQVDISKTQDILGWSPLILMEAALSKTAMHFLANQSHTKD
jgi:UDP-glucose 4-epimerase